MGNVRHDWEYMRGQREMTLSGRHQGGLKNWSECRAGPGVRSCQQVSLTSQREQENKEGTDEGASKEQGASNRVRWLNYCCIVPHVFDKLPQKGKNKQSCTV